MSGPGSSKSLRITARTEGSYRVVKAAGLLSESECTEFLQALRSELKPGAARVVLDLEEIAYLSSAGLGALVSLHPEFVRAGIRLIVAGTNPKVRKLLALTSLDRLIENAESVEEALKRP